MQYLNASQQVMNESVTLSLIFFSPFFVFLSFYSISYKDSFINSALNYIRLASKRRQTHLLDNKNKTYKSTTVQFCQNSWPASHLSYF